MQEYKIEKVYAFDINIDLINTYNVIKTNVEELIIQLKKMETEYLPLAQEKRKNTFIIKENNTTIIHYKKMRRILKEQQNLYT